MLNGSKEISFERPSPGTLRVGLSGDWKVTDGLVSPDAFEKEIESVSGAVTRLEFDTQRLRSWDSGLLSFLRLVAGRCRDQGIEINTGGLPEGVRTLLRLASATPAKINDPAMTRSPDFLTRVGVATSKRAGAAVGLLAFIGESFAGIVSLFRGTARFRVRDLWMLIQQTGADALPIVTIISFLIGWILAFIGAIQLQQFGASIYVANLVAVAMTIEMGAMMTGIIMAGRTGAAYAAELGTMTVNEEIDALQTTGISPIEYLVVPRILALVVMMPMLALYADFVGILGGAVVGVGMLDLSFIQIFEQTRDAIIPKHFILGLIKATVYGIVVAMSGCYYGMRCGRSAAAVGASVTGAVVTGIISIIIASALLTFVYNILGI